MDVQMPVMAGPEATRILKCEPETQGIPVIALTAYAMETQEEQILQTGYDGYIMKPIRLHEFLQQVAKYLSTQSIESASKW